MSLKTTLQQKSTTLSFRLLVAIGLILLVLPDYQRCVAVA